MINTINICRICSSRGEYNIFTVIPAYLHASPNEFLHWKKDISKLLEETTGLTVDPNDGLPNTMCALCISYLKHAATFRQQAIDNILSLKAAQAIMADKGRTYEKSKKGRIELEPEDKLSIEFSVEDLISNDTRKTDTNSLINNVINGCTKNNDYMNKFVVLNNSNRNNPSDEKPRSNLTTYLNLLFDKETERPSKMKRKKILNRSQFDDTDIDCENFSNFVYSCDTGDDDLQTGSSDDNESCEQKANYFSYTEKSFVEDDVMSIDFLKDANIIVNIPENVQERKCPACFRRFMFEDSYKEHMNTCLEFKFLILIENLNRLSNFRRTKTISPHEFIRRMIFCLKKTCKHLSTSCGEEFLPDILMNSEGKARSKSDSKTSECDNSVQDKDEKNFDTASQTEDNPLLELLREKADPNYVRFINYSPLPLIDRLKAQEDSIPQPINFISNKLKLDSTSSESSLGNWNCENIVNTKTSTLTKKCPIKDNGRKSLIDSFNKVATDKVQFQSSTPITPAILSKMNFSARCNACNTIFESIGSLEEHNSKFHNNRKKLEEHKRIIALFESDETDGTVDLMNAINKEQSNIVPKMIKCKMCDKNFSTIMHLDQHKLRSHLNISRK